MDALNLRDYIEYKDGSILSRVIKSEKYNMTIMCMAAGTDMSEHTSSREGFVYVVEGKGTFTLEGNDIEMSAGKIIFMPKGAVHSLNASENTSFLLVLF